MSVDSFIDTNLFLYNLDDSESAKHTIATDIIHSALETGRSCISYQVVQECLNAGLRKAHIPLDHLLAARYLHTILIPLWKINPSPNLYQRGLELQSRYQLSFYDSLIVAAALEGGCKTLYSEDLQHGQRIDGLTIKNPFIGQ
jgi:predicted nucleic acid-binding protein